MNDDGTDEISYVTFNNDMSNINSCHLMTYKNKQWKHLYSFAIRDAVLPELPDRCTEYKLYGLNKMPATVMSDSLQKVCAKELKEYPGLIKKVGKNKIKIEIFNPETEEQYMVVDLRHPKPND